METGVMKRVIIADDSATARMFVRRCFEAAGLADAEIVEVASGAEVLDKLSVEDFDLVITDLNMPEIKGDELIRRMRASDRMKNVPIIVVSSAFNSRMNDELTELGASSVLKKPPTPVMAAAALKPLMA